MGGADTFGGRDGGAINVGRGRGHGRGRSRGRQDSTGEGIAEAGTQRNGNAAESAMHSSTIANLTVHDDDDIENDDGTDRSIAAGAVPSRGTFCHVCTFENLRPVAGLPASCSCCGAVLATPEEGSNGDQVYPSLTQSYDRSKASNSEKKKPGRQDPGGANGKWRGPLFIPTQSRQPTLCKRGSGLGDGDFPHLTSSDGGLPGPNVVPKPSSATASARWAGKCKQPNDGGRRSEDEPMIIDGKLVFDAGFEAGAAVAADRARRGVCGQAWGSHKPATRGTQPQQQKQQKKQHQQQKPKRTEAWIIPAEPATVSPFAPPDDGPFLPVRTGRRSVARDYPTSQLNTKSKSKPQPQPQSRSEALPSDDDDEEFADVQETESPTASEPEPVPAAKSAAPHASDEQTAVAQAERNRRLVRCLCGSHCSTKTTTTNDGATNPFVSGQVKIMMAEAGGDRSKVVQAKEISMKFKQNMLGPDAYISSLSELFGDESVELFVDDLASLLKNTCKREALRKAIASFRLRRRHTSGTGTAAAHASTSWCCKACNFENDADEDRCEMCGSLSGSGAPVARAELRAVVQRGFGIGTTT